MLRALPITPGVGKPPATPQVYGTSRSHASGSAQHSRDGLFHRGRLTSWKEAAPGNHAGQEEQELSLGRVKQTEQSKKPRTRALM